jgi:hypothetical protein
MISKINGFESNNNLYNFEHIGAKLVKYDDDKLKLYYNSGLCNL